MLFRSQSRCNWTGSLSASCLWTLSPSCRTNTATLSSSTPSTVLQGNLPACLYMHLTVCSSCASCGVAGSSLSLQSYSLLLLQSYSLFLQSYSLSLQSYSLLFLQSYSLFLLSSSMVHNLGPELKKIAAPKSVLVVELAK